ncbi:hypothetical protein PG993_012801 [Apiospora rasikravindrae]|uniref:GPI inositol-deacylase winged helix domain-containing protein n=1 Tax=Apiospora rasikravindrae TaxID=990691 RepID=A0ABR1RVT7_9PEZI
MTRITGQLANHAQRATQVLGWIIHAERPLTKLELQHALGVELGRRRMDPERLPETSHLVSVCAGLVTTDEESGIIRLVHYTAQEYFVSTKEHWFPGFQGTILATCISYLSFEEFATRPCHDHDELSQRLKKHPFYDYAATHWGHHASGYQTCSTVLQFLRKKNEVETAMQARSLAALGALGGFHSTGLHMAAGFGLEKTVRELLSVYDVNVRDTEDTTALGLAAAINCLAAVRVLVEKGADLDSQEMALCEASSRGYLEVVRYLIETNSPTKFDPETMRESLFHAAIGSFWETCDFLVEQGADINSRVMEKSLLHAAVGSQHDGGEKAAEYLIEKGANVNVVDGFGQTPLHIAIETWERRTNLVKLLVKHGADVNIANERGNNTNGQSHR